MELSIETGKFQYIQKIREDLLEIVQNYNHRILRKNLHQYDMFVLHRDSMLTTHHSIRLDLT